MTYTVKFTNFQVADDKDALTVEKVYQKYAAVAGVHSFKFDDTLNTWDAAHWSSNTGVTLGSTITQTATNGSDRPIWYDTDMPHSYVAEFTAYGFWQVLVRGNGTNSYYKISADATVVGIEHYVNGAVVSGIKKGMRGLQYSAYNRIKIAVRDAQFTSDSAGRTVHVAVWCNDYLLHTFAEDVTTNPSLKLALVVVGGNSNGVQYSDFRVANLGEIILLSSLDPAEAPIGAIQRAIEDRYIRAWVRWDGSLRAWSPTARSISATIASTREYRLAPSIDVREGFSHLRVLGAFQWVQLKDDELIRHIGHRFREINNTSLWNIDDCLRVGRQLFIRAKEHMFQAQIDTVGYVFLEPEDRIQVPDHQTPGVYLDYILDSISWTWNNGTFMANIQLRRYYY